jgi:hypothetical protein
MKVQLNDIRDEKTWGGKEPKNHSPSFDYCRKLLADGADPKDCLEVYRGEKLAYTVSSIGWGAKKKIREDSFYSPQIVDYKPLDEKAKARLALNRARKLRGPGKGAI